MNSLAIVLAALVPALYLKNFFWDKHLAGESRRRGISRTKALLMGLPGGFYVFFLVARNRAASDEQVHLLEIVYQNTHPLHSLGLLIVFVAGLYLFARLEIKPAIVSGLGILFEFLVSSFLVGFAWSMGYLIVTTY